VRIACPKCGDVYDVSAYEGGQRLRCRCGKVIVVTAEAPEIRAARTIHCSNCGGQLERGRPDCPFCGALVDLTDARLTSYCAHCLSMSKEGARFCSDCGRPLVSDIDAPDEADEICPRCSVRMRRRSVGEHRPLECPVCCGLFVAVDDLETMIRAQEERIGEGSAPGSGRPRGSSLDAGPVTYLKCPVCSGVMNRVNYGRVSGVIVDYCREHGYWLDAGELEKIARWVSSGGLKDTYAREVEDLKAQKDRLARRSEVMSMYGPPEETLEIGGDGIGLLSFVSGLFR